MDTHEYTPKVVRMNITLDQDTVATLKRLSEESGTPMSRIIAKAINSPMAVSPDKPNTLVLTDRQMKMVNDCIATLNLSHEAGVEDMVSGFYDLTYHEDPPDIGRPIAELPPEKKKELDDLRGLMNVPIEKRAYDPMEPSPLGYGVFDQQTGRTITDPDELEDLKYRQ